MTQTVSEVLTAAMDSVTLINDINSEGANSIYAGAHNGPDGSLIASDKTQQEINTIVQANVDHLETILAYQPTEANSDIPNVVGSSSSKKTTCSTAITTGKAYISANS